MDGLQSRFDSRNGSTRRDGQSEGRARKPKDIYSHHSNRNPRETVAWGWGKKSISRDGDDDAKRMMPGPVLALESCAATIATKPGRRQLPRVQFGFIFLCAAGLVPSRFGEWDKNPKPLNP